MRPSTLPDGRPLSSALSPHHTQLRSRAFYHFGMPDTLSLHLRSWDRLNSPGLAVDAALHGASHEFTFENRAVTITLPSWQTDRRHDERITMSSYRDIGGQKEPIDFEIHSVDLVIDVPGVHQLPQGVLTEPPNAYDLIDRPLQERLEQVTVDAHKSALRAYDLWMRTLRWKSERPMVGRETRRGPESGWSSCLIDPTGKRIWLGTQSLIVVGGVGLSSKQWAKIQEALAAGEAPPVSVDLYFDAIVHLENGDLNRTVIDAAVAAETHIRSVLQASLPPDLGPRLRDFIDDANIRPVLEKLLTEAALKTGHSIPATFKDLHKLFNARNDLVHKGAAAGLSPDNCRKHLKAVRELLAPHF
jgi:hypothetical protein